MNDYHSKMFDFAAVAALLTAIAATCLMVMK